MAKKTELIQARKFQNQTCINANEMAARAARTTARRSVVSAAGRVGATNLRCAASSPDQTDFAKGLWRCVMKVRRVTVEIEVLWAVSSREVLECVRQGFDEIAYDPRTGAAVPHQEQIVREEESTNTQIGGVYQWPPL